MYENITNRFDLLLIHPPYSNKSYALNIPLGLCYIASVLEQDGFKVKVLDLHVERLDLREAIGLYQPKVVGISGTTQTRFESFKIANLVKSLNPSILVIYGGCHASTATEDTLKNINSIDIIVRGYGEWIMRELMREVRDNKYIDLHKLKGISYRQNSTICHNPSSVENKSLDEFPYKIRHFLDNSKYPYSLRFTSQPATTIVSSRGCTLECIFCSATLFSNHTCSFRSSKNICDEIEWIKDTYRINNFYFCDDDISHSLSHIDNLCDEILTRRLNILWECKVRVDRINFDILKKMHSAGCWIISFGVETATPRLLKLINKHIEIKQVEDVLNWARKIGIFTRPFFMFGLPTQSYKEALATLDFIDRHNKSISYPEVTFCMYLYPGTKAEEFALENNLLPQGFSWSRLYLCQKNIFFAEDTQTPILIQPQLGFSELKRLAHLFIIKSIFKRPKFLWEKINRIRSRDQFKKYFRLINNWVAS